jgi:hypothetical protein
MEQDILWPTTYLVGLWESLALFVKGCCAHSWYVKLRIATLMHDLELQRSSGDC